MIPSFLIFLTCSPPVFSTMRLSLTTFLAFTLAVFPFFSSQVSAIHPQVLSRREYPSSSLILSSRQHRVPRNILDLCINVNVDLLANASQLGLAPVLGPLDLGSNIHLCLCLKVSIDLFPRKYQAHKSSTGPKYLP
jgi:hypothetical protein